jgi:hypothetical protein
MRSAVRSYFEEMNVPLDFADLMFSVAPEEMILLSEDELARYLPSIDPAREASIVNRFAKLYGIAPSTYRSRKAFAKEECLDRFEFERDELICEEAVLHGVSRRAYLEWHTACEDMDLPIYVEYDNTGRPRPFFEDCPIPKSWER